MPDRPLANSPALPLPCYASQPPVSLPPLSSSSVPSPLLARPLYAVLPCDSYSDSGLVQEVLPVALVSEITLIYVSREQSMTFC